ncbi:flavoprotein [Actinoplanes sp. GCM10030250]|uniref:flavoprotein n=1 Tax=Actinoplanes sp. GCM10030250 TaxID=3273376 RepID=UPI0036087F30
MPVVVLIVSGAPLAQRVGEMAQALTDASWETHVVGTASSAEWITSGTKDHLGVRFGFRPPMDSKRTPAADAVVVCPATFNTTNKIASGIADNYAVSLVCESIGAGVPTFVAPMVNQKLWNHPAWQRTLDTLIAAGVHLLDIQSGAPGANPVQSGTGDVVVQCFQPSWLADALRTSVSR